jgi:hypothetical protein
MSENVSTAGRIAASLAHRICPRRARIGRGSRHGAYVTQIIPDRESGMASRSMLWMWRSAFDHALATDRKMLGSKYCDAGTGFSIFAARV